MKIAKSKFDVKHILFMGFKNKCAIRRHNINSRSYANTWCLKNIIIVFFRFLFISVSISALLVPNCILVKVLSVLSYLHFKFIYYNNYFNYSLIIA